MRYVRLHAPLCTVGCSGIALHPAKRGEVRQMASALLNNYSLRIAEGMPDKKEDEEVGDDVTQIVIGCLDGVGESEDSQVR